MSDDPNTQPDNDDAQQDEGQQDNDSQQDEGTTESDAPEHQADA